MPEVLGEDDIHVLDGGVFDRLDGYSQPRLVRYDCSDFEEADADTDADTDADSDSDVDVEAEYVVGEYDVVILSADESDALETWLQENGYAVPDNSAAILEEYVEGGSCFFAAKVDEAAKIESGDTLSPLQFSSDSEVFSLPIRIGTLNSKGTQDLIIYANGGYSKGATKIANYAEVTVEDERLWQSRGEEFDAFYEQQVAAVFAAKASASWTTEYAWGGGGCDPCVGSPPDEQALANIGVPFDLIHYSRYFFTRLHMRYTPAQAHQDLSLYQSNITTHGQIRYIEHETYLEDRFPLCGSGWAEDPGSCDEDDAGGSDGDGAGGSDGDVDGADGDQDEPAAGDKEGGCAVAGAGGSVWLLAALAALRRRS